MTLENLKDALYRNNLIMLHEVNEMMKENDNVTGLTDEELQKAIQEVVQIINE